MPSAFANGIQLIYKPVFISGYSQRTIRLAGSMLPADSIPAAVTTDAAAKACICYFHPDQREKTGIRHHISIRNAAYPEYFLIVPRYFIPADTLSGFIIRTVLTDNIDSH